MPKQKLPPNALCPCESGRLYGRCCYDKGFEYLVDEHGTVYKAMPMPDELIEALEEQKQRFIEKFGREPGPDTTRVGDPGAVRQSRRVGPDGYRYGSRL